MFKAHASNFRVPGRDVVLKVILGTCPIPDEQAVEHILMELHHPGLFTSTYSLPENRRNEALRCIFAWLREHECGDSILLERNCAGRCLPFGMQDPDLSGLLLRFQQ